MTGPTRKRSPREEEHGCVYTHVHTVNTIHVHMPLYVHICTYNERQSKLGEGELQLTVNLHPAQLAVIVMKVFLFRDCEAGSFHAILQFWLPGPINEELLHEFIELNEELLHEFIELNEELLHEFSTRCRLKQKQHCS